MNSNWEIPIVLVIFNTHRFKVEGTFSISSLVLHLHMKKLYLSCHITLQI